MTRSIHPAPRMNLTFLQPTLLTALLVAPPALAQQPPPASSVMPAASEWTPPALEPFVATYQALYKGKEAGDATMRVVRDGDGRWRVDMAVHGKRGFAGRSEAMPQEAKTETTQPRIRCPSVKPLRASHMRTSEALSSG